VNYIYSDGLPCLLEGQSSATFSIQKEFFDGVDISANERIVGEVKEAGVVDTLDRRYPINRRNLARLLKESFDYPTTIALFVQKGHPDRVVASFPIVDRGAIVYPSAEIKSSLIDEEEDSARTTA
jgi:hypothetical protein